MVIKGYKTKVKPTDDVRDLKFLIDQWREKEMVRVKSSHVVPDSSNRMHTGLSVDHIHYIATNIMKDGFRTRQRGPLRAAAAQPHDIPVLVRGSPKSEIAKESLEAFHQQVAVQRFFPRIAIPPDAEVWFTSLGNGHFTQALNCFRQEVPSIFTNRPLEVPKDDIALQEALEYGVESVVLRAETPIETRREVAHLLNATHNYKWAVDAHGVMDIGPESCQLHRFTNFEAMSKDLDNEALTQLVRYELGVAKEMDDRWDAENAKKVAAEKLKERAKSKL